MRSRLGFLLLSALLPRSEETEFTFEGGPERYLRELTFDGKAYTIRGGERDETYQHLLYFPGTQAISVIHL